MFGSVLYISGLINNLCLYAKNYIFNFFLTQTLTRMVSKYLLVYKPEN